MEASRRLGGRADWERTWTRRSIMSPRNGVDMMSSPNSGGLSPPPSPVRLFATAIGELTYIDPNERVQIGKLRSAQFETVAGTKAVY